MEKDRLVHKYVFFRCTGEKQTSCWLTHFHPEVIFKFYKKSTNEAKILFEDISIVKIVKM